MRHRKKGRRLGRSASHRRALLRNMASSLLLTERQADVDESGYEYLEGSTPSTGRNEPKVKGRIVTTISKAKELRPYVEKCITVAKKAQKSLDEAKQFGTSADRDTDAYRQWRQSDDWNKWNEAMAPALAARRRAVAMLGNQKAVEILFDDVARRYMDRDGGYTRIMRLATPRLGDAGTRAVLELVGNDRDRVRAESERPSFEDDAPAATPEPAAPAEPEASAESSEGGEEKQD
ncbi:MAG: L17 family ribosomal protein [Pirellulaceae bacterium]